jgi:hypothetical protein
MEVTLADVVKTSEEDKSWKQFITIKNIRES